MKLCGCGCGLNVKSENVNFLPGHHNRSSEVKQKKKDSLLKKYGFDNPSKVKSIQDKKIETSILNHGTSSPNQAESVKQKKIDSSRIHYGVDHPHMIKEIRSKVKRTMKERFGVEFSFQSEELLEKSRLTSLKNWGTDHPMESNKVKEIHKQSMLFKYGVENSSQLESTKEKKKETARKHFGTDHFSKTIEGRAICREAAINFIETQRLNGESLMPRIGYNERPCILELKKHSKFLIDTEYKILGCFPDGYIKELNLIIEFDEQHHKYTYQKKIDRNKDDAYLSKGLYIYRITTDMWKNKEETIQNFIYITEELAKIIGLENQINDSQDQ